MHHNGKGAMQNHQVNIASLAQNILREEDGATAIEYGLMAALIAVACIAGFQATGGALSDLYAYWSKKVAAVL